MAALFERDGDGVFRPGEITRGPWSDDAQHAGPVAALVAGLCETSANERDFRVVRITFELLRPLPLRPLAVATEVTRSGRSADRIAATVTDAASGELLAEALALRLRRKPVIVPEHRAGLSLPPPGDSAAPDLSAWGGRVWFITDAVDLRVASGEAFDRPGPAAVWFRLRVPVVADQEVRPIERVCVTADSGNGISNVAPFTETLYINPDLTVGIDRDPVGEWICLDAATRLSDDGFGMAESRLHDIHGRCGSALQSLLVSAR
jgi:hypothetical protein